MPTKSFRGLMLSGDIDTISLHTNDGSIGYRIKKFELMPYDPTDENIESVTKVFTIPPREVSDLAGGTLPAVNDSINFSDNTLLAAGFHKNASIGNYSADQIVVFDNMTFNQDIYVTFEADSATDRMNYYIELEQVKLRLDENTVATLKDIRNIKS